MDVQDRQDRKYGVVLIQPILCIRYIHVRNSDFGSGSAGLGEYNDKIYY